MIPDLRHRRRRAERTGRRAETLAVWFLRCKGYRILARDWRCPAGEIDILAQRGAWLVAVEVKARADATAAMGAVSTRQRQRIARAAGAFLAGRPHSSHLSMRFDVIVMVPRRWPLHIIDAWQV